MASEGKKKDTAQEPIFSRAQRLHILNHELLPHVCRIRGICNVLRAGDVEPVLMEQLLIALGETGNELDRKLVQLIQQVTVGRFDINEES